jgi:hypothetical protein
MHPKEIPDTSALFPSMVSTVQRPARGRSSPGQTAQGINDNRPVIILCPGATFHVNEEVNRKGVPLSIPVNARSTINRFRINGP